MKKGVSCFIIGRNIYHSGFRRQRMNAKIVLIPGDGIGPEIVGEAKKVLEHVAARFGHTFSFT